MVVIATGVRFIRSVEDYNDAPPEIQARFERAALNTFRGRPSIVVACRGSFSGFEQPDGRVTGIRWAWRQIDGAQMTNSFDSWSDFKF